MTFDLLAYRFRFLARGAVYFPAGQPGNILRGAFGTIFRKIACGPQCPGACAYERIFEPRACGRGPSGLADWPRPFVFRAAHLDERTVEPGESFHFDLHFFDTKELALPYFERTFAQLGSEGLGPGRGRAELLGAETEFVSVSLLPEGPVRRATVRFVTPTELKGGQALAEKPEFGILFARIRDRVSTLGALYGAGPLEIDFRAMGERAAAVRMVRCDLKRVDAKRRSGRTGQTHPLGGFVGEAEYEGELGEFVPYLRAAHWTGVGRQTVWGKGEVEIGEMGVGGVVCGDGGPLRSGGKV